MDAYNFFMYSKIILIMAAYLLYPKEVCPVHSVVRYAHFLPHRANIPSECRGFTPPPDECWMFIWKKGGD